METLNPIDHPDFWYDDMSDEFRATLGPMEGCYTPKNPSEIIIKDNFDSEFGIFLAIYFTKCK